MNRKDLRTLTLAGPTRNNPVLDPLAVQHLDNQLYMYNIWTGLVWIFAWIDAVKKWMKRWIDISKESQTEGD